MKNNGSNSHTNKPKNTSTSWSADRQPPHTTTPEIGATRIPSQATEISFAQKLMNMINDDKFSGVIGWSVDGKSFSILKRNDFKSCVLPAYFGPIKLKSFKKRLSRHGFETCQIATLGHEDTAFFHPNFMRDRPELCVHIVPLGTKTSNKKKKRRREENEDQPSKEPRSSFPHLHSIETPSVAPQPPQAVPRRPAFITLTDSVQVQAQDGRINQMLAATPQQGTVVEETYKQQSGLEPAVKRIRETPASTSLEVSMTTEDGEDGTAIATRRSHASAVEESNKVLPLAPALPKEEENDGEQQSPTLTGRIPATCHTEAVTSQTTQPLQPILSLGQDGTRSFQSQRKECRVLPCEGQDTSEAPINYNGEDGGSQLSEDERARTKRMREEHNHQHRPQNAVQTSSVNHFDGKNVPNMPHERLTIAFAHSLQRHWLQSELQAVSMSARAAFLRNLSLQLCTGPQGSVPVLGGGPSPQLKSMDLLQQQLQAELGIVRSKANFHEEHPHREAPRVGSNLFLNGVVAQRQVPHWRRSSMFPDSEGNQASWSLNPHQETSLNAKKGGRKSTSAAYDPVGVILEAAPSLGLKFSS